MYKAPEIVAFWRADISILDRLFGTNAMTEDFGDGFYTQTGAKETRDAESHEAVVLMSH